MFYTHIYTDVLRSSELCPGLPRWAGTRTNSDFTEATNSEWQWHRSAGPYANLHLAADR